MSLPSALHQFKTRLHQLKNEMFNLDSKDTYELTVATSEYLTHLEADSRNKSVARKYLTNIKIICESICEDRVGDPRRQLARIRTQCQQIGQWQDNVINCRHSMGKVRQLAPPPIEWIIISDGEEEDNFIVSDSDEEDDEADWRKSVS